MVTSTRLFLAYTALCLTAGCGTDRLVAPEAGISLAKNQTLASPGQFLLAKYNPRDAAILQQAVTGLALQIAMAQQALARSRSPGVLELARHILELSQRGQQEILGWAAAHGTALDPGLSEGDQYKVASLLEQSAAAFDTAYLHAQEDRLQDARDEAVHAASQAEDAQVRAFAQRSVPEIEELLARVRNTAM